MMKIAIDARWIFRDLSGIGNYTRQLLREIARMPGQHTFLVLFSDAEVEARTIHETGIDEAPHMQVCRIPWTVFSPQSQIMLPRFLRQNQIDVFHSPNYMIPFLAFARNGLGSIRAVTTIHDLIPLRFPDHAPRSRKARVMPLFRFILKQAAQRSARVLTVSHVSASDITSYLHVPSQRIQVVHNGVSPFFQPPARTPQRKPTDQLQLIYIGRADPYKNIERLIYVVDCLRTVHDVNATLRLVGSPDPRYPAAEQLIQQLGIEDAVSWTGYLRDAEMLQCLHAADIMVHASRYEGFGLQILEAMASGVPVVCSHAGSLPEVAGDAALYADPDSTEDFVQAILRIARDQATRDRLIEAGFQQAASFSWQETARQTIRAYEQAAEEGHPHDRS